MKKQPKRLGLQRATIRLLNGRELDDVAGGVFSNYSQNEDCSNSCNSCTACPTIRPCRE